jgi:5-methylcytosine-specific restriction endonuclease McrA
MAARGFKIDKTQTASLFERGLFRDSNSYITFEKKTHGPVATWHLILFGVDKSNMRAEVFRQNRAKYRDGYPRCDECNRIVSEQAEAGQAGEWDHILNQPGTRCDCPENAQILCRTCHVKKHPRVQWTKNVPVKKKLDTVKQGE